MTTSRDEVALGEQLAYISERLDKVFEMVALNNTGIAHMLGAMETLLPDEVIDPEGDVFTVAAETHDGTSLVYTVQCITIGQAIQAATEAWGQGGWGTLRKRRVQSDGGQV